MKIAFYDTHAFERPYFEVAAATGQHTIQFLEPRLSLNTVSLAANHEAVCVFVNDDLSSNVLDRLSDIGIRLVALRCAGFNRVDLEAAERLGIRIVRVPEYSPHAVAEHAVALLLAVNRRIHRAYVRCREMNFSLDGLVGFDLYKKTVGTVGTGRIGKVFAEIMLGFGAKVIAHDQDPDSALIKRGVQYVEFDRLLAEADVVSFHIPLTAQTHHLIGSKQLAEMKPGALLINTGRGGLIDTQALVESLKSGHLGGAGLDVYEEEEGYFFQDHSEHVLQDDVLSRLLSFPNVLVTSHQGFLTREALSEIARQTIESVNAFVSGSDLIREVKA